MGQCQCECGSDCTSGDLVTCDCPEPAFACAPGFTQVCPLDAGACPTGMSPKCPGGGAPPTTTTTTTTTPAPPAMVTGEVVDIGQVKCGKVKYQCKMTVTYMDDCSTVSKVSPSCTPKKSKCTKGVSVSIETANGCTVTGKYKNTGKQQSQQLPVQLQLQGKRKGANVCLTSSSTGFRLFQQVIQQTMPARAFQTLLCSEKKIINPHFSV